VNQHGEEGVRFWTKVKTITQRWPDGSAMGSQAEDGAAARTQDAFVIPTMG